MRIFDYRSEQAVGQTVDFSAIWDDMTLMWRHCNGTFFSQAFALLQQAYGLSPALTAEEMASGTPDRLALLAYLVQLKGCLEEEKSTQSKGQCLSGPSHL